MACHFHYCHALFCPKNNDWLTRHVLKLTNGCKNKQEGQDSPVSLTWSPDKFELVGLLVHEKKFNIDFHDDRHLGFSIRKILATFDLQVCHLDTSNEVWVNCPFGSGEKVQNWFSTWLLGRPSWISDQNYFSYFWSISHPILPIKFWVNGLFYSGEEVKNRFTKSSPCQPSWIFQSERSYIFVSTSHTDASYQIPSQLAFWFRRRSEKQIFMMAIKVTVLDFRLEQF